MNHSMKIALSRTPPSDPLLAIKTISVGARLWTRLFGRRKLVIIVPGGTVDSVTITEKGAAVSDDSD